MLKLSWKLRYNLERLAVKFNEDEVHRALNAGATHKQISNMLKSGVNLTDYSTALEQGVPHEDLEELTKSGTRKALDVPSYLGLLDRGVPHRELVRFKQNDTPFANVKRAMDSGASTEEYHDWVSHTQNEPSLQEAYFDGRKDLHLQHPEMMEMFRTLKGDVNLSDYVKGLVGGISKDSLLKGLRSGVPYPSISRAKTLGIDLDDLVDAKRKGVNPLAYLQRRKDGQGHSEILSNAGVSTERLPEPETSAIVQQTAPTSNTGPVDPHHMQLAIKNGANIAEIREAHSYGVLPDYAVLRASIPDHLEALDRARHLGRE